jgi:hypothetical protein
LKKDLIQEEKLLPDTTPDFFDRQTLNISGSEDREYRPPSISMKNLDYK